MARALSSFSCFTLSVGGLTVTNVGFYAALSVLTLHLVETLHFNTAQTALVLACASFGLRFMRVILAPVADRLPPQASIRGAILLSMLGYLLLARAETAPMAAFAVLLAGTGYGVNGMLVTALTAAAPAQYGTPYRRYVLMNLAANFAAAIGPLASGALRLNVAPHAPFLFAAGVLCISLLISFLLPKDMPALRTERHWFATAGNLLRRPATWRVFLVVALGWALYTQKYASIPLLAGISFAHPEWVGRLVAANALIILAVSLPFARFAAANGWEARHIAPAALLLYGAAYGVLAASPQPAALWLALPLWSFAEGMLMPALNTLIAAHAGERERLTLFSLSAAAIGAGEAAGNIGGVALYRALESQAFFVLAVVAACAALWMFRPRPAEACA